MQKSKFLNLVLSLFLLFPLIACAARAPSQARVTRLVRHHFNEYAKKYKTSPFGNKKVMQVELLNIKEIRKHSVAAEAFVTLQGPEVFKVRVTLEKGPFGWRTLSWENLSGS